MFLNAIASQDSSCVWFGNSKDTILNIDIIKHHSYLHLFASFRITVLMKQAEKLKSCEMKEGWVKNDEGWMKNDEGWWYLAVEGFWWWTKRQTDICECIVAFVIEN